MASKVQSSPHKNFDLPENLEALDPGQHVCITGKVTKLDTHVPIQNRFGKVIKKQESIIADVTGQVRAVLWENEIGKLVIDASYKLDKISVRIFNDVKYLSLSTATIITPVDDVGEVTNLDSDEELIPESGNRVMNGSIIGVVSIDSYSSCVNCKGKVEWISGIMGQCTRCNIKLKYGSCNQSQTATLIFKW